MDQTISVMNCANYENAVNDIPAMDNKNAVKLRMPSKLAFCPILGFLSNVSIIGRESHKTELRPKVYCSRKKNVCKIMFL